MKTIKKTKEKFLTEGFFIGMLEKFSINAK